MTCGADMLKIMHKITDEYLGEITSFIKNVNNILKYY